MAKIIDMHSHCMPPEVACHTTFFKAHWSDIDRQLSAMDELGIEKALLLYPTSDAHIQMGGWGNLVRAYNEGIAGIVKRFPGRFVGAGIIPVDGERDLGQDVQDIADMGLRAISLASSYEGRYLDDPYFEKVFIFAGQKGFPVHVHPQIINPIGEARVKDPLLTPVLEYVFDVSVCIGKMMMEGTFLKFPAVKFIFAHYGGVIPVVKERFDNTYLMLRRRDLVKDLGRTPGEYFRNLYFDISGSRSPGSLICALEMTDADHILWGSDFPANQDMRGSARFIEKSSLKAEEKEKILYRNALDALGCP